MADTLNVLEARENLHYRTIFLMISFFPGQTQDAIIVAAGLATVGWLYTARRARALARKQHTFNVMLTGGLNEGMRAALLESTDYLTGTRALPEKGSDEFERVKVPLRRLLNYYELIAAGIRRGDLDEGMISDNWRGAMVDSYERLETYIVGERKSWEKPSLFEHLEWLHRRWKKRPPSQLQLLMEKCLGSPLQGRSKRPHLT